MSVFVGEPGEASIFLPTDSWRLLGRLYELYDMCAPLNQSVGGVLAFELFFLSVQKKTRTGETVPGFFLKACGVFCDDLLPGPLLEKVSVW